MNPGTPTAERYLELVRRFPLRPIRDEKSLEAATAMIDELLRLPELSDEEDDYLDVLSDLVEKYEAQTHPIPDAPTRDVLRYLMDCRGLNEVELAKAAGLPESVIRDVLAGERELSPDEVSKLARHFGVNADVLS